MSTIEVNEKVPDNGYDSASEQAEKAEAERLAGARAAAEKAAAEDAKRKRSPVYVVMEYQKFKDGDANVGAWVVVGSKVKGATDRKAITAVIGTHEAPVEGFDAERRLLPHVAVLTRHWEVRTRTRTVNEPTPKERAELEKRLAGTVTEEWS